MSFRKSRARSSEIVGYCGYNLSINLVLACIDRKGKERGFEDMTGCTIVIGKCRASSDPKVHFPLC
jgi:hypothetical protein